MALVKVTGVNEIEKVLDALDGRDRQNLLRRAVRAGAKPFQAALKANAASRSDVPRSFAKVPAAKVSASMRRGGDVVAVVRPKSPLFNIFQPGAGSHTITPGIRGQNTSRPSRPTGTAGMRNYNVNLAGRPILAGPAGGAHFDHVGRKRPDAFFATSPVRHPGMDSRDMLRPAFAAGQAAASKAFADVIFGR